MLYVIGALVLAVFVGILVIAIKKENAMQKQMLEELNHAQIEELNFHFHYNKIRQLFFHIFLLHQKIFQHHQKKSINHFF